MLALGIASDAFPIPAELGVVHREQLESGHRALTEFVDGVLVAEHSMDLPMRRDRPRVHNLHMALRRDLPELFWLARHFALLHPETRWGTATRPPPWSRP